MTGRSRSRLLTIALAILFVLLAARLAVYAAGFVREGLQMDFAAFWTAGRASAAGLSPYESHVERVPPIWDGVASHRHSRFLYPPPAANLFSILSRLSYPRAKALWTILILHAVTAAAFVAQALVDRRASAGSRWCFAAIVAGFHPVLTLLERGQVDGLVLLLVVVTLASRAFRRAEWAGGALFALVVLLKLHLVLAVPLLFHRRPRAFGGFAVASLALVASAVLLDGTAVLADYFGRELPRISRFGESGPRESRIPPEQIAALRGPLAPDAVALDGRTWRLEMLEFTINASLVRTPVGHATWVACRALGWAVAPGHVGVLLFVLGLGTYAALRRRFAAPDPLPQAPRALFASGLAAITWAQLVAPLGWSMGTVLLLPAAPLALRALAAPQSRSTRPGSWLILAGLAFAAVVDPASRALLPAGAAVFLGSEYVVAQSLVLVGLLVSCEN